MRTRFCHACWQEKYEFTCLSLHINVASRVISRVAEGATILKDKQWEDVKKYPAMWKLVPRSLWCKLAF